MKVVKIAAKNEGQIKRVAAYARVSTLSHHQEESYETQIDYYKRFIQTNPCWVFAGIYADQGISGTSREKRPAFMSMVNTALAGEIDLILVKSISRFSRNLVDCQKTVAALMEAGVEVRFEREGISTFDPSSDFVFSLLSAVAQQESQSISENVRWSYQRRFARGDFCLGNNRMLGYDTDPMTKRLVPNKEAWVIQLIFRLFLEGLPYCRIAEELEKQGAKRLRSAKPFDASTIRYILSNETYVGDKLLQKSPPKNFLTKKPGARVAYESYYMKDEHEGLVDRKTWEEAQRILRLRKETAVDRVVSP